jgi:excisionase family DNA binding protein
MTAPETMRVDLILSAEQVREIARVAAELRAATQTDTAASPWLDTAAAAEYLCSPRSRVHDLVQLHRLKPHRDGRRLLFRRADLDAYLEGQSL